MIEVALTTHLEQYREDFLLGTPFDDNTHSSYFFFSSSVRSVQRFFPPVIYFIIEKPDAVRLSKMWLDMKATSRSTSVCSLK